MLELLKDTSMPMQHRLGKLMVGTAAGFIATVLAEKGYDVGLKAWRNRKATVTK
jgi:hypothetical protein